MLESNKSIQQHYGNVDCQVFKGGKQNYIDFLPKINSLKGYYRQTFKVNSPNLYDLFLVQQYQFRSTLFAIF